MFRSYFASQESASNPDPAPVRFEREGAASSSQPPGQRSPRPHYALRLTGRTWAVVAAVVVVLTASGAAVLTSRHGQMLSRGGRPAISGLPSASSLPSAAPASPSTSPSPAASAAAKPGNLDSPGPAASILAVSYAAQARAGMAALQVMYNGAAGSPSRGLFCTGTASGTCWWDSANELNAMIDYSEQTGSTAYLSDIATTYAYAGGEAPHSTGAFLDRYYDDNGWWGLTWLNAYRLTGITSYLQTAENNFAYIQTNGWDSTCGGGVWQFSGTGQNGQAPTKDTGANSLYITLGARLYQATQDPAYLNGPSGAESAANWFLNTGLITPSGAQAGLVKGHLTDTCAPFNGQKWSNYQGIILGGLTDLYLITGNTAYLATANTIASAVLADTSASNPPLIDAGGILTEVCTGAPYGCDQSPGQSFLQYKGIFLRNLYCLNTVAHSSAYANFIANNAAAIVRTYSGHGPAGSLQFGFTWDYYSTAGLGPSTQGSALDALIDTIGTSTLMCSG